SRYLMTARRAVILLISLLLCMLPPAATAQDVQIASQPLKLDQAVQLALSKSRQISNRRLDIEISKDRYIQARARLFPDVHVTALGLQLLSPLNFRFNKGVFGNYPLIGKVPGENTNVTTDQRPIFFLNTSVAQPITQITRVKLAIQQSQLS